LFLSSTKTDAPTPNQALIAQRKLRNIVVEGTGMAHGGVPLLIKLPRTNDVVTNGDVPEPSSLVTVSYRCADVLNPNCPAREADLTQDTSKKGRFTAAYRASEHCAAGLWKRNGDALKHRLCLAL
jgi:hypothetical protein